MVYTDASDKQFGAVISQNNKPIAFFSRIISNPQRHYSATMNNFSWYLNALSNSAELYLAIK